VRNLITNLFSIPLFANMFIDASIADQFELPDYS